MKDYTVAREFWRRGVLQPIGEVLRLTKAEAKYLAHALEEKAAEVEHKVEAAVKRVRAPRTSTAVVVEAPADGDDPVN